MADKEMQKVNVLIVDDSRSMRMLIKRCIRQAGFDAVQIDEANDGAEGLQKLAQSVPQLVLSDWNMPGMGGEDFARSVHANFPSVTLGFITSEASSNISERAMAIGAKFLLTKPFDAAGMESALAPYLGKA